MTEPEATFSACFGSAFLMWHPVGGRGLWGWSVGGLQRAAGSQACRRRRRPACRRQLTLSIPLPPPPNNPQTKYASMLADKVEKHGTHVWLINTGAPPAASLARQSPSPAPPQAVRRPGFSSLMPSTPRSTPAHLPAPADLAALPCPAPSARAGWTGGPYGVGYRFKLRHTRAIVDAIHSGELERGEFENMPIFNLQVWWECGCGCGWGPMGWGWGVGAVWVGGRLARLAWPGQAGVGTPLAPRGCCLGQLIGLAASLAVPCALVMPPGSAGPGSSRAVGRTCAQCPAAAWPDSMLSPARPGPACLLPCVLRCAAEPWGTQAPHPSPRVAPPAAPAPAAQVPKSVSHVPQEVLLPSNCWADKENYTKTLTHLAELFNKVRPGRAGGGGGAALGSAVVCSWSGWCRSDGGRGSRCGRGGNCGGRKRSAHPCPPCLLPTQQNFEKFADGGGHVTPDEATKILAAGPAPK